MKRDQLLAKLAEDLEVTSSEFAASLADGDASRAIRALDDLRAIVKAIESAW